MPQNRSDRSALPLWFDCALASPHWLHAENSGGLGAGPHEAAEWCELPHQIVGGLIGLVSQPLSEKAGSSLGLVEVSS